MKIIQFTNANNQKFALNMDNVDVFWAYEPENKLFMNMGSIQYTFILSTPVRSVMDQLTGAFSDLDIRIDSWTSENILGPVDVIKLN